MDTEGGGPPAGAGTAESAAAAAEHQSPTSKRRRHEINHAPLSSLAAAIAPTHAAAGGGGGSGASAVAVHATASLSHLSALRPTPLSPSSAAAQLQQLRPQVYLEHQQLVATQQQVAYQLQQQQQQQRLQQQQSSAAAAAATGAAAIGQPQQQQQQQQQQQKQQLQLQQEAMQRALLAQEAQHALQQTQQAAAEAQGAHAAAAAAAAAMPIVLDPHAALASIGPLMPYLTGLRRPGPAPVGDACDPLAEAERGNIPAADQPALRDWQYIVSAYHRPGVPPPSIAHLTGADLLRWLQRDGGKEWEATDARRILRLYDEPRKVAVALPWLGPNEAPRLGTIEWFEFKHLHQEVSAFRARFQAMKNRGFFNTLSPATLREFLLSELGALLPDVPNPHPPPEARDILQASIDNLMESMGERPISEARYMRLMMRIKCAMQAQFKEQWRLGSAVHCPLCALKLASYVI